MLLAALAAALLALVPATARAGWPLGSRIDNSVVVDVTDEGFDALTSSIGGLVPERIDVPPTTSADSSGCLFGACLYSYDLAINGMWVTVEIPALTVAPGAGNVLNIHADATVTVNSPAEPAVLDIAAELAYIDVIDDTCNLYIDPISLTFDLSIQMALVDDPYGVDVDGDGLPDTKKMDATVPTPVWSWDASGDDIQFTNCGLADVINSVNEVTGFFGLDLYDLILDQFTPTIDDLITTLPGEIEPAIEDGFSGLTITQELDLLGVPLSLTLWPGGLETTPEGMRIALSTVTDVPMHACVAQYGIDESLATPSALPAVGETPTTLPFIPHLGAAIDDDFVNQVLFAAWAGGLLCFDLTDGTIELPLPIDTTILGLIAPGVFDPLFPEPSAMGLVTDPSQPPRVDPGGGNDVDIAVDGLGIGFFVDIDGRQTRLLNIDLAADAGVNVDYDGTTGNLGLELLVDPGAFTTTVTANEFAPDATAQIEASFGGLLDTIVAPLLAGLGPMAFPIPAMQGVGVTALQVAPADPAGEVLGGYLNVGPVPFYVYDPYAAGCEEGCDTSSCDTGCGTTGVPASAVLVGVMGLAVALRRRR